MYHTKHTPVHLCIMYKPGPELYIKDWSSHHNYAENKSQEISGVNIGIYTSNTTIGI